MVQCLYMAIFDELKSIAGTLREADKIPQYEQILSILEKLLEMQKKISDLEFENKELREKLKTKEELVVKNDAYYKTNGDGPYCLTCHDSKDILVHMVSWGEGNHKCNNCDHVVETDPEKAEQQRRRQEAEINRSNRYDKYI